AHAASGSARRSSAARARTGLRTNRSVRPSAGSRYSAVLSFGCRVRGDGKRPLRQVLTAVNSDAAVVDGHYIAPGGRPCRTPTIGQYVITVPVLGRSAHTPPGQQG